MTDVKQLLESRHIWAAFFLTLLLAAGGITPSAAVAQEAPTSVNVSPAEARVIARRAIANGNIALADGISTALLERDPNDAEALLIRALAARAAGALDIAEDAAARAYRVSDVPALQFDAAFIMADLKTRAEQFTRAQIWLRRADNAATDEPRKRAVEQNYRAVSQRNPLSVQLAFSLRPSDNINNGSAVEAIGLFGFTGGIDDPIAAIDASAAASLRYKISESPKGLTQAYANIFARRAILESGFEDIVPGTTPHEYDYVSLSFGLEHRLLPFPDLGVTTLRFGYGGGYYRNEHFLSAADIALSQEFRLDEKHTLRTTVSLRDEHRFDTPAASTVNTALAVDYIPSESERFAWSIGTTLTNFNSAASTVSGSRIEVRTRIVFKDTLLGGQPDLSLSLAWRDLPEFDYFGTLPNGRQDISADLRLGMTFTDVSYFGFQPRAEMSWSKTDAEVDIFDTDSLSFGITAVSRF